MDRVFARAPGVSKAKHHTPDYSTFTPVSCVTSIRGKGTRRDGREEANGPGWTSFSGTTRGFGL